MAKYIFIYDNDQLLKVSTRVPYESLLQSQDTEALKNKLNQLITANENQRSSIQDAIDAGPSKQVQNFLNSVKTYLGNVNIQVADFINEMDSRADNVATKKAIFVGTPQAAKEYFDLKGIDYTDFI